MVCACARCGEKHANALLSRGNVDLVMAFETKIPFEQVVSTGVIVRREQWKSGRAGVVKKRAWRHRGFVWRRKTLRDRSKKRNKCARQRRHTMTEKTPKGRTENDQENARGRRQHRPLLKERTREFLHWNACKPPARRLPGEEKQKGCSRRKIQGQSESERRNSSRERESPVVKCKCQKLEGTQDKRKECTQSGETQCV